MSKVWSFALLLVVVVAAGASRASVLRDSKDGYTTVVQGRYLVRAGDCRSCHTVDNGQPFSGGRPVPTPFGIIYSTNITPDRDTGIGAWSDDDFYRALHQGVDRQGRHLYPAFPYPWFTRLSKSDVHAIKAYLDTLPAVRAIDRPNKLAWPMSVRGAMAIWNGLYFDPGTYRYDDRQSPEWNRGAYLAMGAGHCGACHTDKNIAGASKKDHPLQGGFAENVYAPNLGSGMRDGLGGWSEQDIIDYLKTGANAKASAAGPMAEVVEQSTQYLTENDLHAMATFLKSLPATSDESAAAPAQHVMSDGSGLYRDQCAGCHMNDGRGLSGVFPPLAGNASVQASAAATLVSVVLQGARMPATRGHPTGQAMPEFADKLDDEQVATLISYIRNAWGNHASSVSAGDVADLRKELHRAPE